MKTVTTKSSVSFQSRKIELFDVIRFLDDYNIPWWPPGSENVSQGRVGVTCPFCDDSFNHLGLDVRGRKRPYCWKCGSHTWYDYIKAMTGESQKVIREKYSVVYSHSANTEISIPRQQAKTCIVPGSKDFKSSHLEYLEKRGFDPVYTIRKYDLRVTGMAKEFGYRIIIPVFLKGKPVSYQGRSYVDAMPKYLTCYPEKEVVFHKDTLYNIDNAQGESVILVEGVFDAMKMGDNTVASFGTFLSNSQLNILSDMYRRVVFLYDGEKTAQSIAVKKARTLSSMGLHVENIVLDTGDAGDLSEDDALHLKADLGVI